MGIHHDPRPFQFDTDAFEPGSRLAALRAKLDTLVLPGELTGSRLRTRIRVIGATGSWSVARIATSPLSVVHGGEHVTGAVSGYLAWLQLDGTSTFLQGDREIVAHPGTLVVRNACLPSTVRIDRPSAGLLARVPGDARNAPLTGAIALDRNNGPGVVFQRFLLSLDSENTGCASEMLDSAQGTLRQLLEDGLGSVASDAGGQETLHRILAVIERNLDDPEMCARGVAAQTAISVRTLYRTLSRAGIAFRSHVLERRLERCRADLIRRSGDTVAATCLRWGFNDVSHFCRAFRSRYGVTPTEYRGLGAKD